MDVQAKQSRDLNYTNPGINNMIIDAICNIGNGSVTIIKQDKTVIQINVSERISFGNQTLSSNVVEEAIL